MSNVRYTVSPKSTISIGFFRELWFFRRLIWMFIRRDILVRYKNTAIGAAWYLTQPFAMMLIFTIFFARAFSGYIGSVPYPIFAYSGLLLWQMYSRSLSLGAGSLTMFEAIMGKIYFPRIIAPISIVLGTLFDFMVASVVLVGMMFYYRTGIHLSILAVPAILLLTSMCALGFSCILAGLDARTRDIRHTIPLLIQIWMFCTPVMYPSNYVPQKWHAIYDLNPMVGLTEWFRWFLFQAGPAPEISSLRTAAIVSIAVFTVGIVFFQKVQGTIIDTL